VYHMTDFGKFSPQQGLVFWRKGKERSIKGQVGREYVHNSLSSIIWVSLNCYLSSAGCWWINVVVKSSGRRSCHHLLYATEPQEKRERKLTMSNFNFIVRMLKVKVKLSHYTPWRHMGGEEV
jgi:hypothetical protein